MENYPFKSGYVCDKCGWETETIMGEYHRTPADSIFEVKGRKYANTHFEQCGKWVYFNKRLN